MGWCARTPLSPPLVARACRSRWCDARALSRPMAQKSSHMRARAQKMDVEASDVKGSVPKILVKYESEDGARSLPLAAPLCHAAGYETAVCSPLCLRRVSGAEVKFDIGGKKGKSVNCEANVDMEKAAGIPNMSVGVAAVEDRHLMGKLEFNDPNLFCVEAKAGVQEGEWQLPYNVGIAPLVRSRLLSLAC